MTGELMEGRTNRSGETEEGTGGIKEGREGRLVEEGEASGTCAAHPCTELSIYKAVSVT